MIVALLAWLYGRIVARFTLSPEQVDQALAAIDDLLAYPQGGLDAP